VKFFALLMRFVLLCLMAGSALAQSFLSPCPTSGRFHNCQGTYIFSNGNRYVGEWRENAPRGSGVMYFSNGDIYSGQFGVQASGVYTFSDGRPSIEAFWSYDNTVRKKVINSAIGESIIGSLNKATTPLTQTISGNSNDRVNSEIETDRNKRQELEQQVASNKERDRITAELDRAKELAESSLTERPRPQAVQRSERRVALVIGNAQYKSSPLVNAVNDATDIDQALKRFGFQTTFLRNASLSQMREATRRFADQLTNADVALIYFAGHGIESKNKNFMIPVNADLKFEYELADQAYDAAAWLEMLEMIKSNNAERVNIVILDACRNNNLIGSRSLNRGLARMDAPTGTFLSYSTAPGKVAADGGKGERNSPFTKNLLKAIQQPGQPIEEVFKEVRRNVTRETNGSQVPWESTSLTGFFSFRQAR
jgi:Caspase domain/MORN repeat